MTQERQMNAMSCTNTSGRLPSLLLTGISSSSAHDRQRQVFSNSNSSISSNTNNASNYLPSSSGNGLLLSIGLQHSPQRRPLHIILQEAIDIIEEEAGLDDDDDDDNDMIFAIQQGVRPTSAVRKELQ